MTRQQAIAIGQNHGALHRILQLAHVAGPRMRHQHRQRLWRQGHLLADIAGDALDKVEREARDVFLALTQRRNRHREDRQPEIQVLTELTGRDGLSQHPIGGGDNADVDLDRRIAAKPLDALGLDRAQHLRL